MCGCMQDLKQALTMTYFQAHRLSEEVQVDVVIVEQVVAGETPDGGHACPSAEDCLSLSALNDDDDDRGTLDVNVAAQVATTLRQAHVHECLTLPRPRLRRGHCTSRALSVGYSPSARKPERQQILSRPRYGDQGKAPRAGAGAGYERA